MIPFVGLFGRDGFNLPGNQITIAFFYVGFAGGADEFMSTNWDSVAFNQTLTKLVIGWLVFLPAYGVLLSMLQKKVVVDYGPTNK